VHTTNRIVRARRDRITRASRVRLLARQVAAGEYHVDPERLAEVLIERSLFHRRVATGLMAEAAPHPEA
jgi:anti-sigma-28 factor FlgM